MGQDRISERKGSSLPPRRFASTLFRVLAAAADRLRCPARLRTCTPFVAALPALALMVSSAGTLRAQQPELAARTQQIARTQQFVAERSSARSAGGLSAAQALVRARAQHLAMRQQQRAFPHSTISLGSAWQPLGPSSVTSANYGNVTGRVTSIATDLFTDSTGNTVYIGTTGGGVWKSTNAAGPLDAVTFVPLTDDLEAFNADAGTDVTPSLSIGAIAVQPAINPIVIAGTGDPNDATDSLYGEGLLLLSTATQQWTLVQGTSIGLNGTYSFIGLATAGIAFSTTNPSLVVAAFSTSAQSSVVDAANGTSIPGLYYSTNAGQSWQMATIQDGSTIVQTPQPLGTAQIGNAATSVVWDAQRGMFYAAVRSHGYYGSPDGETWTRLTAQPGTGLTTANCPVGANGAGSANCPIFRGTLAVQPSTGDLYALTVDAGNNDQGLWQDLCNATSNTCATTAPAFANRIDNGALEVGSGSTVITQGSYNLALNAAPAAANSTDLYVGTVDLYRCAISAGSSSCSLRDTTNALDGCDAPAMVAPAQHAIATVAQTNAAPILYLGNDSGLWRSLTGVNETGSVCSSSDVDQFDNLNAAIGTGGSLAEVVGFAQDPTNPNTLIAGLGANGSAATSTASTLAPWPQLSAGEGGYPSIDPNTPANWYVAIGAGVNLVNCTDGANCNTSDFVPPATIGEAQVDEDASLLDAPTLLDPQRTTSLITGTCRVWRGPAGDGAAWSSVNAISPPFIGAAPCTTIDPLIRSLAAGGPDNTATGDSLQNLGSEVIYAGIAGSLDGGNQDAGQIFLTNAANLGDSSLQWDNVGGNPVTNDTPDAYVFNPYAFDVSSITVDPHDPTGGTVYATIMGFGAPHVYLSTDFGGAWLNISANLPDAPANAVVVDPNAEGTVYVALDTGVYVTTNVTSCTATSTSAPLSNCWSILGTSLPNAPVVALAAAPYVPTGNANDIGMLRAGTYGRGIWQIPLVTAGPPNSAAISVSPGSLSFGEQQVETQSTSRTITITSDGNGPVAFAQLSVTTNFVIASDGCSNTTLAVGSPCSVQIVFAPTTTGALSGLLTIDAAGIPGGSTTVSLNGTGTTGSTMVFDPLALSFPTTIVNQTSAVENITVSNTGASAVTLQSVFISGEPSDFTISANSCTGSLAPQTGCTISIEFTPTKGGARSATLNVTDSAGTQLASLTGTADAPATDTLSPLALSFTQQQIGTRSPAQTVTLTNAGGVPLTLIAASMSSTDPTDDFSVANACGNSLAPNSSCSFQVTFAPTAVGTRTATLTIADQFRVQTVTLTGIGIAGPGVSLSPVTLTFPATGVGLTALPQTFTLTNNGGLPLTISSLAVSPGFIIGANTCGTSLAIGTACSLTIVFAPTAPGPVSGTLTFTDNAPSGSQTTTLSGVGIDFTLSSTGPTSVTTTATSLTPATYPMELTSLAGLSGNVALTCSGEPANSTCLVTPSVAPLGSTVLVSVTVQTGVATSSAAALQHPPHPQGPFDSHPTALFALLFPAALLLRRRRMRGLVLCLALTCTLGVLSGCGTSRIIPTGTSSGTTTPSSSGTYTITVSASSAGLTHSVDLTLIVQ